MFSSRSFQELQDTRKISYRQGAFFSYHEAESTPDTWFLVKDSWETAYRGPVKGYFFYRADYLKLKVLMFMTHKNAVVDLLAKFKASN